MSKVGKTMRSSRANAKKASPAYSRAVLAPNVIAVRRLTPQQRRAMVRAMLKTA